jgi:hypothetical protein
LSFPVSGLLSEFEILALECRDVGAEAIERIRRVIAAGAGLRRIREEVHDPSRLRNHIESARPRNGFREGLLDTFRN